MHIPLPFESRHDGRGDNRRDREPRVAISQHELDRDLGLVFADLARARPRVDHFLVELALNVVLGRAKRPGTAARPSPLAERDYEVSAIPRPGLTS